MKAQSVQWITDRGGGYHVVADLLQVPLEETQDKSRNVAHMYGYRFADQRDGY